MGVAAEPFGVTLRRLRESAGLTQEQLAESAGLSVNAVSALERAERRHPYPSTVRALATALGLSGVERAALAAGVPRRGQGRALPRRNWQDDMPRPAQLPADVGVFTGRVGELAELDRLLNLVGARGTAAGGGAAAMVISAVSGTAGVGKTALALHWAHQVRVRFPDGQLYLNLRGYDPDQPVSAGDALARFLRALGLAGHEIPVEVEERAAVYRNLLDGRRMLVVLDNAGSVEQVRPLLPGTPSALVVVTSRDSLAGLVARHGARRLEIGLLPLPDAMALLRTLIGERIDAEPDAATMLAERCARLPLALRVAAELAAVRPDLSLTELVGELADERQRLDLLDAGGDRRTAVRSVFSWSYRHLSAEAARAFRLIGLHPGPDLDPYAAAALTDASPDHAQRVLDLLARAHLLAPTRPDRYGMHDLLRVYATQLAAEDSEQEGQAALTRLFDHYLGTAAAAMDTHVPAERHRRPRVPAPATSTPSVADPIAARAWLDAERATLTAACAYTAAHGWLDHTTRLASTLFRYLDTGGHYLDALTIHTHALHAARHTADPAAEAHALTSLGVVYQMQGHYQQAVEHHQQALALFREIADQAGEAHALDNLGGIYSRQGRYEQAVEHHRQALDLARDIGDRVIEVAALDHLGVVHGRQSRYEQAAECHQQALTVFSAIGDPGGEAKARNWVGETHRATGSFREASTQHTDALALATQIGDRYEQARAHNGLARTQHATGDLVQARHHWREALALYIDLGVPDAAEVRAYLTTLDQAADDDN